MVRVIVDTSVIIDYLRTNEGLFLDLLKKQSENEIDIVISSITVYELFSGKSSKYTEQKILELLSKIKIIFLDDKLAKTAGELNRDIHPSNSSHDLFIAATAILCDSSLATKNKKHFSQIPNLKFFAP